MGFWIALGPDGPWESSRSLLPVSVMPKLLEDEFIAMEVVMRNGNKRAIFRSLATLMNDTDVKLDISVYPLSKIDTRTGDASLGMDSIVTVDPGSSYVLPWQCMSRNAEECLRVRPHVDSSGASYSWGLTAKDQHPADQGSLSRQTTMKQGNRMPSSMFKLNELEKKDILVCCSPFHTNKQFWLSAATDASVLHTELNAPVYDWKISINSPLKLENRLPCPAEFIVWELSLIHI